jgi:hypothetical protein
VYPANARAILVKLSNKPHNYEDGSKIRSSTTMSTRMSRKPDNPAPQLKPPEFAPEPPLKRPVLPPPLPELTVDS